MILQTDNFLREMPYSGHRKLCIRGASPWVYRWHAVKVIIYVMKQLTDHADTPNNIYMNRFNSSQGSNHTELDLVFSGSSDV